MDYKIIKEDIVFDDFFKIKKATLEHDTFSGDTLRMNRLCFERGDAVAILIYEKDTQSLLFTKQFRYPATKDNDPWLIEIAAGMLNEDEYPEYRVIKEVEEELGYHIKDVEFINSSFVSPGGTSERILLYYTEVNTQDKTSLGGGVKYEHEDIELVKMSIEECTQAYYNNTFRDAKTIMAIQWFLLHKK